VTCDTPCPLTTIKPTPLIQSETRLDKYLLRWFLEADDRPSKTSQPQSRTKVR
jgi:hypothetical protein